MNMSRQRYPNWVRGLVKVEELTVTIENTDFCSAIYQLIKFILSTPVFTWYPEAKMEYKDPTSAFGRFYQEAVLKGIEELHSRLWNMYKVRTNILYAWIKEGKVSRAYRMYRSMDYVFMISLLEAIARVTIEQHADWWERYYPRQYHVAPPLIADEFEEYWEDQEREAKERITGDLANLLESEGVWFLAPLDWERVRDYWMDLIVEWARKLGFVPIRYDPKTLSRFLSYLHIIGFRCALAIRDLMKLPAWPWKRPPRIIPVVKPDVEVEYHESLMKVGVIVRL